MKKYKLFLDDIRTPESAYLYTRFSQFINSNWEIVRNYNEFVDKITSKFNEGFFPELIAFDHDLSVEDQNKTDNFKEKTGMDCAKWLVEFCIDNNVKLPDWYVHSMNPVGSENINTYLLNYKKYE